MPQSHPTRDRRAPQGRPKRFLTQVPSNLTHNAPMEQNITRQLLEIARQEAASKEAEIQTLRSSLRYRVGGWMLEASPPGIRTLAVFWRLFLLYVALRRGQKPANKAAREPALSAVALRSSVLVLGTSVPAELQCLDRLWHTEDPKLMALRLDSGAIATTIIVRRSCSEVLRRIARVKLQGAEVLWWPEASPNIDPALIAYIRSHADECRDGPAT